MSERFRAAVPIESVRRRLKRNILIGLVAVTVLLCCGAVVALNRLAYDEPLPSAEPTPPTGSATPAAPTATGPPGRTSGVAPAGDAPDVVGRRLSEAKVLLAGAGYTTKVLDATGQGRLVLEEQNWVVASQEPAAGAVVTLRVRKPTDGQGSESVTVGVVPDVLCKDLQNAQDALRSARYYNLHSEDATGRGRLQILDRDWVVVGQSEPPETSPAVTTRIVLRVVKFGEPTGESGCQS